MAPSPRFWNRVADKYAKQPVADEAAYQKKLEKTREYFTPDTEVLEIGCGTGTTAIAHAPYVKRIRAVDISEKMLEICQRKAAAAKVENVTFGQSSIEDLRVDDESYDVVMAHSLLHLLEDKAAALAKIRRMLKPGGVLVSSTVCLGDNMKFFKMIAPIGKFFGIFPLVKIFTRDQLRDAVGEAGFEIEHDWRPEKKSAALFLIARKPAEAAK